MVGMEELAAGKLCALLDRLAPRDLFDAVRLPELASAVWGGARLRAVFVALAGTLPHPVHSYGRERLERASDADIAEQLYPMLSPEIEAPDGAALRNAAWAVLEPLLTLTEAEREFTDRLQLGDLRPELLSPDDGDFADRVARHPALRWKAENAARRRSQ